MKTLMVALTSIILLSSCSSSADDRLLGKWVAVKFDFDFEFFKDNTCIYREISDGQFSCQYNEIEDGRIKVTLDSVGNVFIVSLKDENTLEVAYSERQKIIFQKKK